ncbi:MAG: ABC transporter substrate-binding protein [Proteobacteria bacterium]|nr:ABC transporter substrate-binding protein [Pseudomonadota bacterium]
MQRRTMLGACAALACATLALAAPATVAAEPLRVAVTTAAENAPFFSAVEKGLFAKQGLDVKVEMMPSGVEISNALASGSVDVGLFGTYPFLTAVSRGVPLVLIGHTWNNALNNPQSEVISMVGRADAGVSPSDLKQLKGKKVGVTRGAGGEPYIAGILQQEGMTLNDVTLVNTAPSSMATALANKDADVIVAWEPWPSAALTKVPGSYKVLYGGCKSCYDAGTLVTTKDVIAKRPKDLAAFVVAYAEGQAWVRGHREEAAEISTRWIPGMDAKTLTLALQALPLDVRMSKNTVDGFKEHSIPLLVSQKRIPAAFDPTPAIDNQFVAAAMKKDPSAFADLKPLPADKQLP